MSVIAPLLDLYGREAAAYVQGFGLKAVAVVSVRLLNSRSPEKSGDRLLFGVGMDKAFLELMAHADEKVQRLLAMPPVIYANLPKKMPERGIYLLSDGDIHLYVGRSNHMRRRLGRHCLPGATYRMAALAFRLARHKTGNTKASYRSGLETRANLIQDKYFLDAFSEAKTAIRAMNIRYVEEDDPTKQALLEIYTAVILKTPHNEFDTH